MNKNLVANILLILPCIMWGISFPAIKIATHELDILGVALLRHLVGVALFLVLYLLRKKRTAKLRKQDIKIFLLLGFLGGIIYHLSLNYSETIIGASLASIIISTIPVFTAIFAWLILNETLTKKQIIGIILAIIGSYVVILDNYKTHMTSLVGFLTILVCVFAWTFNTIFSKRLLAYYDSISYSIYIIFFTFIWFVPFSVFWDWGKLAKMSSSGIISILYLGIVSSFIAVFFWFFGLKYKKTGETSSYILLLPFVSVIFSWFYLDEKITMATILGGLLILAGVFITNKRIGTKLVE